ncbi:hypothetical protein CE143_05230 [Photorhabdus luminescens]|uniref:CdiI immunity protein domain-containing protein n=2 Tax=Photorhabdus TaxID=29487 RepID=A0A2S8PY58_9GAMM|nr:MULTISPECIES: contact-dependent growth inhibition system immunity protein [Photorhabdus]PQQ24025.1 hypothetical protein C6H66_17165 [Photorhabdus hindustanensis]QXF32639.1 hypothetical protein B0X70_05300 [Photorhabdus akhurstii]UJD74435.1 hypothetical protein CE143_05230 [Photorhabdus luminescens]
MEKEIERKYIDDLTLTYFHQDYQLFGETIDEIATDYLNYPITIINLIREINNFSRNSNDVEKDFHSLNYHEFVPELWETTALDFLNHVSKLAQEYLDKDD